MNATTLRTIMNADAATLSEIIQAVKLRQSSIQKELGSALSVGDRVTFNARGRIIKAKVTKVNRKTVALLEIPTLRNWKVSPSLLTKV